MHFPCKHPSVLQLSLIYRNLV